MTLKHNLQPISSIPFLICLFTLLLNDFYLKTEYHNWLTGKLSDFCGLFVFVTFWAALLPSRKLTVYFSTALLFAFWKSPYSQHFLDFFSENFYRIERVIDLTDLVALVVLPIAFYCSIGESRYNPIPIAFISFFAFCATSVPPPSQKFEQPQYVLFKSGIVPFVGTEESGIWRSEYKIHTLDSILVIDVKEIRIAKEASLNDDFHKVQILKRVELLLLREALDENRSDWDLSRFEKMRDSLTVARTMVVTLNLDSITDQLNFRGTRLHGHFKRIANNNQLLIVGTYKDGIEDSVWTFYNRKGEITSRRHFENGELTLMEQHENSKMVTSLSLNTRSVTIRNKYFHISFIGILIIGIALKLFLNYRNSKGDIVQGNFFGKIGGSLVLPFVVFIIARWISSLIPSPYEGPPFGIFFEFFLVYIITTPSFLIILFSLKKKKFDLLYYILLMSLAIVFTEEVSYLKALKAENSISVFDKNT